jgi:hypothetical protein
MPRKPIVRIDDTLAHIQQGGTTGLPQNALTAVVNAIGLAYPRATPQDIAALTQLSHTELSVKKNIAPHTAKGTPNERRDRRAIALLWMLIDQYNVAARQRAMTAAAHQVAAEFEAALVRAAVKTSNHGATHVFNMMFSANPLAFIQRYRLVLYGSAMHAAKFTNPNSADFTSELAHNFCYDVASDAFMITPHAAQNSGFHQFQSVNVPALHWSDVPGRTNVATPTALQPATFANILGTDLDTATWMITTQLTGCSFCYFAQGATAYAAHILPAAPGKTNLTGAVLAAQLIGPTANLPPAQLANFPGAPVVPHVFGNGVGNLQPVSGGNMFYPANGVGPGTSRQVYIFGKRAGPLASWEIYEQALDSNLAIVEARRLV